MSDVPEDIKPKVSTYVTNHMANERTFLAWVRTGMGIMAFGFVVERFALFIKQIAFLLQKNPSMLSPAAPIVTPSPLQGYSSLFGIFLVILGAVISLLAFFEYRQISKQIDTDSYMPTQRLNAVLTVFVLLIAIFLAFYLNNSF